MKRMTATDPETKLVVYNGMPNFPIHGNIFRDMEGETIVYERWRDQGESKDFSDPRDEGVALAKFCDSQNRFSEEKVSAWIDSSKSKQSDKQLEGCFVKTVVKDLVTLRDKAQDRLFEVAEAQNLKARRKPMQPVSTAQLQTSPQIESAVLS